MTSKGKAVIKEGYLVKSPPLNGIKDKGKQWRRAWFVLFATTKSKKPTEKKDIALCYFESKESFQKGIKKKGKIELTTCTKIQQQTGSRHGFNHVFCAITPNRTYFLCAETRKEKQEWYSTLKNYVPCDEVSEQIIDTAAHHNETTSGDDKFTDVNSNTEIQTQVVTMNRGEENDVEEEEEIFELMNLYSERSSTHPEACLESCLESYPSPRFSFDTVNDSCTSNGNASEYSPKTPPGYNEKSSISISATCIDNIDLSMASLLSENNNTNNNKDIFGDNTEHDVLDATFTGPKLTGPKAVEMYRSSSMNFTSPTALDFVDGKMRPRSKSVFASRKKPELFASTLKNQNNSLLAGQSNSLLTGQSNTLRGQRCAALFEEMRATLKRRSSEPSLLHCIVDDKHNR